MNSSRPPWQRPTQVPPWAKAALTVAGILLLVGLAPTLLSAVPPGGTGPIALAAEAATPTPTPTPTPKSLADGSDPLHSSCRQAVAAGLGPYKEGVDPEYDHYVDADHDGYACDGGPGKWSAAATADSRRAAAATASSCTTSTPTPTPTPTPKPSVTPTPTPKPSTTPTPTSSSTPPSIAENSDGSRTFGVDPSQLPGQKSAVRAALVHTATSACIKPLPKTGTDGPKFLAAGVLTVGGVWILYSMAYNTERSWPGRYVRRGD